MGYLTRYTLRIERRLKEPQELTVNQAVEMLKQIGEVKKALEEIEKRARRQNPTMDDILKALHEIAEYRVFDSIKGKWEAQTIDRQKWYEHETDMKLLSQMFPEFVFELEGHGEDWDDLWIKYFHNGKIQREPAVIRFGRFDPEKLEDIE